MNNKDETLNQTNERGSRFNLSPCFRLRQLQQTRFRNPALC